MSGSQPLKSYALSVAQQDVPSSWMPESRPRLANTAARRIVSVASQSGTVSAGQPLLFQLPSSMGAGFLVSGSAYIKFTVAVTQATAYSWGFKQSGSGSSVFQRISAILSGANVESVNMANKLFHNLLLHATNLTYLGSDARVNEGVATSFTTQTATVCVPIPLGCLNAQQHLPLFLLSSALLQFDTETVLAAIQQNAGGNPAGGAVSAYEIRNASICFEQLVPEPAYEQGIKAMLASRVYQMKIDTWANSRYAHQQTITQTIGLNSSSVRCILWGSAPVAAQNNPGLQVSASQTRCQVFADGALVHNSQLDCSTADLAAESYAEMNRALGLMFDSGRTSADISVDQPTGVYTIAALTRASYVNGAFLGGISLSRETLDNGAFSFVGTPVQNLVIQWSGTAINGGEFYVFCAVQQILTIDMAGSVNLIR